MEKVLWQTGAAGAHRLYAQQRHSWPRSPTGSAPPLPTGSPTLVCMAMMRDSSTVARSLSHFSRSMMALTLPLASTRQFGSKSA